jgi:hyperosmotically inducible protein
MKKLLSLALIFAFSAFLTTACDTYNESAGTRSGETKKMTDSELESAIKTKINSDTRLSAAGIDVSANADRNEATLSGTVESQELRTRAVELAKSAHSSLVITDKIDVKPGEVTRENYTDEMARRDRERGREAGDNVGNTLDDAWIHTKIVAQLVANAATPERKINVDVNNNTVTLRGTVDSLAQKSEAEKIAKETEGVKRVVNQLKVASVAKR